MRHICLSIVAVALLAVVVAPTTGFGAEAPCSGKLSSVQKKVDGLVKQWEAAGARPLGDSEKKAPLVGRSNEGKPGTRKTRYGKTRYKKMGGKP